MNSNYILFPRQAMEWHFTPDYEESIYRLNRMGAINDDGLILGDNLQVMAAPFVLTLYENLLESDVYVMDVYEDLVRMNSFEEHTGLYLYLCLLYAQMGEDIPEPLQWLSSCANVLAAFCETLVDLMTDYLNEDGYLSDDEEDEYVAIFTPADPGGKRRRI